MINIVLSYVKIEETKTPSICCGTILILITFPRYFSGFRRVEHFGLFESEHVLC